MFDICIIKATGRLRTFINLPKVLKGKHTTLPEVKIIRANKVKITSDTLLVSHVDGELMESYVYDIELYPKSLNVLSP
jgi:diacylglycerol kinase family enzyme